MVRAREKFGMTFGPQEEVAVKLEDIDETLVNKEVDIQTCIVGNVFDWTFKLKDGVKSGSRHVLCKLKLLKNLTSGEANNDSNKVVWHFNLAQGQKVSRSLYLLDIGSSVSFDCRIATKINR